MRNMTDEQFDHYQKIMDELHVKDIKTNEIDLFNLAVKALSFSNHKFLHWINKLDKASLKESMIDTSIALPIAWGMSYLTLILMYALNISDAFIISLLQTIVLTVVSILRKYIIRTKFKKIEIINNKKLSDSSGININHLDLAQRQEKYPRATN